MQISLDRWIPKFACIDMNLKKCGTGRGRLALIHLQARSPVLLID
jgi:hypothetical protein